VTRGRAVAAVTGLTLLLTTVGCGVRLDDQPRPLAAESIPYGLLETSTSVPAVPRVTLAPEPSVQATSVFLVDNDDFLVEVQRQLAGDVTVLTALESLLSQPTEAERNAGLTTALSSTTELRGVAGPENGLVTIDLSSDVDVVSPDIVRLALAQLVYTATAVPRVERVLFQVDGQAREVPTGEGQSTAEPLSPLDYRQLLRKPTTTTATDGVTASGS